MMWWDSAQNTSAFATNTLSGGNDNDTLIGRIGIDVLAGGPGTDTLSGGDGGDTLAGGTGIDSLTGGAGSDKFQGSAAELNGDTILDYQNGEKISLTQSLISASQVQLVAAGTDTQLQIDADNNGSFETVVTLAGTVSGNIILTTEGGLNNSFTNNVIRIVTEAPTITSNDGGATASVSGAENTKTVTTVTATDTDLGQTLTIPLCRLIATVAQMRTDSASMQRQGPWPS